MVDENRTPTAIALHDGRFDAEEDKTAHGPRRTIDDYYRMEATAGSTLTVEVRAEQLTPAIRLDPVIAIVGRKWATLPDLPEPRR